MTKLLVASLAVCACGPTVTAGPGDEDGSSTSSGGSTGAPASTGSTADTTTLATSSSEAGSSSDGGSTTASGAKLLELHVDPPYALLDSATGGQTREFVAIAVTATGEELDVTDQVQWSLDGAGSLDQGVLTSPESIEPVFERVVLSASLDGLEASAFAAISVRTQGPHAPQLFNLSHRPEPRQLDYRPTIDKVDVFFLLDTVSWADQDYLPVYYDRVINLIVPQLQAEGLDIQFGSGRFSAFPLEGSGEESCGEGQGDQPFELWSELSPDVGLLQSGLAPAAAGSPLGCLYHRGSFGEALYQVATGEGLDGPGPTFVEANPGRRGGVGFREDSLAIVFSTTFDILISGLELLVPMEGEALLAAHPPAEVIQALQEADIVHVGQTVHSITLGGFGPFHALAQTAVQTGAVVPPAAWNHPDLGRPNGCAVDECCVERSDGYSSEIHEYCPLASQYQLDEGAPLDPNDNISRDFYALTHYLLTDVTPTLAGEHASVSGVALPEKTTTDAFLTLSGLAADNAPEPGMPPAVVDGTMFRDVSPNTNLNYEVTVNTDAVPSLPGEPLLYRVSLSLQTGYRAGSTVQEFWIVSPPQPK